MRSIHLHKWHSRGNYLRMGSRKHLSRPSRGRGQSTLVSRTPFPLVWESHTKVTVRKPRVLLSVPPGYPGYANCESSVRGCAGRRGQGRGCFVWGGLAWRRAEWCSTHSTAGTSPLQIDQCSRFVPDLFTVPRHAPRASSQLAMRSCALRTCGGPRTTSAGKAMP